ncbi:hypothetical protein T484DRAFT_1850224 [Baffinella frigidus]|nr:hypothetical protein T484DRAFT_1850224 [Cryptophyta sp. CCMP2293]
MGSQALLLIVVLLSPTCLSQQQQPDAGAAVAHGGRVWRARPFIEQAAVIFSRSLSSDPRSASVGNYTNAARAFAIQVRVTQLSLSPNAGESRTPEGETRRESVTLSRCIKMLKLEIDGVSGDYHLDLGELLAQLGERDAARAHFREGLASQPAVPKQAEMLALLEEEAGQAEMFALLEEEAGQGMMAHNLFGEQVEMALRLYDLAARLSAHSNQRSFRAHRIACLLRLADARRHLSSDRRHAGNDADRGHAGDDADARRHARTDNRHANLDGDERHAGNDAARRHERNEDRWEDTNVDHDRGGHGTGYGGAGEPGVTASRLFAVMVGAPPTSPRFPPHAKSAWRDVAGVGEVGGAGGGGVGGGAWGFGVEFGDTRCIHRL